MKSININDVASVYSGKSNTCYCGCAGTYSYNPAHVDYSGKNRGYEVTSDEVNLKTVKRIVNKLNRSLDQVTDIDNKIFTLKVGNHDYTVYLVDRTKEKIAFQLKETDRKTASAFLVKEFNAENKDSVVYLKLIDESTSAAFQIHFRFNDPLVDSSIYDRGNAVIYPNNEVYERIKKLAYPIEVKWNNSGSIGWLKI